MSDYLDPQNEDLIKDFFEEANLQVEMLEQNLLVLENDVSNSDAIDEIFRAAHTIKGAAATVQMKEIASFTHTMEDVLDEVRSGNVVVTDQVVDVLLGSIDVIKSMLGARTSGEVNEAESAQAELRLRELAGQKTPEKEPEAAEKKTKGKITEYEVLELIESLPEGESLYVVSVEFDEDNPMNTVGGIQVYAALKSVGTVQSSNPILDLLYEDVFYPVVDYYVSTTVDIETIQAAVTISEVTQGSHVEKLGAGSAEEMAIPAAEVAAPAPDKPAEPIEAEQPLEKRAKPASPPKVRKPSGVGGSVLRVDSKRIDGLLNLVSEAVINKATFNQITQSFSETQERLQEAELQYQERMRDLFDSLPRYLQQARTGKTIGAIRNQISEDYADVFDQFKELGASFKQSFNQFRTTAQNLGRITGELQEGVMQIRMVPIAQIFSRFPRLVRDVSKSLGKQVKLELEGEDTELDKSVIEDLLDPLIHCVRNAVDHGIESPGVRAESGKPAVGRIELKASNEGNLIVIEISDDGKGIDVEAVHRKAIDNGAIHPSKQLSELEAFNLIFEAGFSTAGSVTDISGRGVGLDVVKRQIEKLNGNVSVNSEKTVGTRITIKLPLTLAIIQGLLVRVGQDVYALPITSVLESHRITRDEIKTIDNYEVMNVRDEVVSLMWLSRLFRFQGDTDSTHHYVVIVGTDERKVGLIVDTLIGEEDVVIKPLRDKFTNSPGIAGATILGDGKVALIIDVSQLLDLGLDSDQRREMSLPVREG